MVLKSAKEGPSLVLKVGPLSAVLAVAGVFFGWMTRLIKLDEVIGLG